MDHLDEIKSRISIEDLVGQYVPLKKMGRHFKALCPFHKERTPSFVVSPERQLAYCFGCHKGGDQFKFIQEMEGVDFRGALTLLAEKTGVVLPKSLPQFAKKSSQRDRLIEMHEHTARYFEEALFNSSDGKKVLSYLKKRGLKEEIIKKARLGFAPAVNEKEESLYTHLLQKNFTREEILASGLAVARDIESGKEQGVVDRFRQRLMFPIHNSAGDICAFGGRALADDQEPKYLNSPETALYNKREILYGLSFARAAIRTEKRAILVEGYMDALSLMQAGIYNAVACSGTALTEEQLRLLKRFTNDLVFAFDRDTAGKLATQRAIELALEQDFSVKIAVWEGDAKDPDECLRDEPKKFHEALKNALLVLDYLLIFFGEQNDSKKKIVEAVLPFLAKIVSAVERDEWIKICVAKLQIAHDSLYDELKRFTAKLKSVPQFRPSQSEEESRFAGQQLLSTRSARASAKQLMRQEGATFREAREAKEPVENTKGIKIQEYLLGMLLTYPESCDLVIHMVQPEDFEDIELQNIYRSLSTQYNQSLGESVLPESSRADILRMYIESRHADMKWEDLVNEIKETARKIVKLRFEREKRSLVSKLREAKGEENEKLITEYQELLGREESIL